MNSEIKIMFKIFKVNEISIKMSESKERRNQIRHLRRGGGPIYFKCLLIFLKHFLTLKRLIFKEVQYLKHELEDELFVNERHTCRNGFI